MTSILNPAGAILSVVGTIMVWLAIYLFREIVLTAERFEKIDLGSIGILLSLPLLLVSPIVVSYYYLTTGVGPSAETALATYLLFLLGVLLLIRPVLNLVRTSKLMHVPKFMIISFVIVYGIANLSQMKGFPLLEAVNQLIFLSAELLLGICFILLSRYTANFKSFEVKIYSTTFNTSYELSALLLIAGSILPMDATLRSTVIHGLVLNEGVTSLNLAVYLRFISKFLLGVAGFLALIGMVVFKKAVEDFCLRFGTMDALFRKTEEPVLSSGARRAKN